MSLFILQIGPISIWFSLVHFHFVLKALECFAMMFSLFFHSSAAPPLTLHLKPKVLRAVVLGEDAHKCAPSFPKEFAHSSKGQHLRGKPAKLWPGAQEVHCLSLAMPWDLVLHWGAKEGVKRETLGFEKIILETVGKRWGQGQRFLGGLVHAKKYVF